MIRPLRKRHLQIWIAWAFLLPVGIIVAWISIPTLQTDALLQPFSVAPLKELIKTVSSDIYTINIRKDNDSTYQLEWINKKTLTYPTATIYKTNKGEQDISKAELIGRIEARGTYYFPLKYDPALVNFSSYQLILYDFIHGEIIETITF